MKENLEVVTLGGGNGHSLTLSELGKRHNLLITAVCPATDSGGSSGILMRDYDLPGYVGDVSKCILALSKAQLLADTIDYRFTEGSLEPHSVKNIILASLMLRDTWEDAIRTFSGMCGLTQHEVWPVSSISSSLHARFAYGNEIRGETEIDKIAHNPLWNPKVHTIQEVWLQPKISALPQVMEAILRADHIVICPGDIFTSIIPILLVGGVFEAIKESRAKITFVLNIMTKMGETDGFGALDFVDTVEKYLPRKVDYVLYNNSLVSESLLFNYRLEQKHVVSVGEIADDERIWIGQKLWQLTEEGFLYHDPHALSDALISIFNQ